MLRFLFVLMSFAGFLGASDPRYTFGNSRSNLEVFIFTDWLCPFCQAVEPTLEPVLPTLLEKAQVTFAELPLHPGSKNFIQYGLAAILNNKDNYLKVREVLNRVATADPATTSEKIALALQNSKISLTPASEKELGDYLQEIKSLAKQLDVRKTPTVVIRNRVTHEQKKMEGNSITKENLLDALQKLNQK